MLLSGFSTHRYKSLNKAAGGITAHDMKAGRIKQLKSSYFTRLGDFFWKTIMLIPELIAAARSRSWELRISSVILQEFVG